MYQLTSKLIIYRSISRDSILFRIADAMRRLDQGKLSDEEASQEILEQVHRLLDLATVYGFNQNLWQNYLAKIINQIKNRNYRFVIYMDDLSFEESELEYKYLKAIIEGGLEPKPENVLIYATSNRKHLVRETWRDKTDHEDDDVHKNDTVQEKLSLSARFGLQIGYFKPSPKEFIHIVETLAARYPELTISQEELRARANVWELSHGGFSGRTAQQFIDYLLGSVPKSKT